MQIKRKVFKYLNIDSINWFPKQFLYENNIDSDET